MAVSRIWSGQSELKEPGSGPAKNVGPATSAIEFKDWKQHLLHSLDKLRDHFCFVSKLLQLAIVAGDVLLGKEKIQKILLARLIETVVMWLSDELEFWDVFEDDSCPLHPLGLQQLILDMYFTVEIAVCEGYPSRKGPQNIKMAKLASKRLLELEPEHSVSYVFLSDICVGVGRWSDVEKVIATMKSRGVKKPPG
ncbi:hypothetical protein GIB67_004722 [Kingdonia uniflora]|uniref:Uncharacterized protein n=1 Tax=Kingdonia uniflora TaxID=39325 RepID=A0A7J7P5S0_9MAGN|nr:hypothetical protein GIB67_004722 [Kingdonia uniflora]